MNSARGGTRRRLFRGLLLIAVASYLGLVTMLAGFQEALLFPGRVTQGRPEAAVTPSAGAELLTLATPSGERVAALFGAAMLPDGSPHPRPSDRPTLIYCYGNGMCLAAAQFEFTAFRRMGANVIIPEYLGYGLSGGKPGEGGCNAAASAAYDHLKARSDIDPKRIVACGWSLGGAVAIDLAAREPVAGLITFCTFTSMVDMARSHYPFLPVGLLLRHRFQSESKVRRVTVPFLIGHGDSDEIIPFSMARRLQNAAGGPVTFLEVRGAGHNDFFSIGGPEVFAAMVEFLDKIAANPR